MGGRHPLVHNHRTAVDGLFRQGLVDAGSVQPELFELLRGVELPPEIERDPRLRRARRGQHVGHEAEKRAGEVLSLKTADGGQLPLNDRVLQFVVRHDGVDQRRHRPRVLVVVEDARSIHGVGNGRGRVCQDRDLFVERFDDRHTEPLVLARAQEQVGDVVVGDELFVGYVAGKVHVAGAERRRQLMDRRQVALVAAVGADDQQAGPLVERRVVRVKKADQVLDLLVRDDAADEHDIRPVVVELTGHHAVRLPVEI